jgi:hypothetical protein
MHSNRAVTEKRQHVEMFPIGSFVGTYCGDQLMTGRVYSHDGGGWIYVEWRDRKPGYHLPTYLRSTQVFPI